MKNMIALLATAALLTLAAPVLAAGDQVLPFDPTAYTPKMDTISAPLGTLAEVFGTWVLGFMGGIVTLLGLWRLVRETMYVVIGHGPGNAPKKYTDLKDEILTFLIGVGLVALAASGKWVHLFTFLWKIIDKVIARLGQ